ncbi:MAG TPA: hypothetical protein VKE42_08240 [Candidatus Cybelea sp.]|nr:hypothetical protein [Candidatus Cybelea sp.]
MSKKPQRTTDELNIELSKISTAFSIMETLINNLPDSTEKKALVRLCAESKNAQDRAFEQLGAITRLASAI